MKQHRRHHRARRQRGIFITDAVIGVSLLGVLLLVTAVTTGHDYRARRAAAEHRALAFVAEAALLDLRAGQGVAPAGTSSGMSISVTLMPETPAPRGYAWARVVAAEGRQSVSLDGLVPAGTPPVMPEGQR